MAYTDVPLTINEKFSVSQPKIQQNFKDIKTLLDVNHGTFGGIVEGKHQYVSIPNTAVVPATTPIATTATEVMLYAQAGALYFRPVSQAAGTVTNDINFTSAGLATPGWLILPSGIIMKWGYATASGVATIAYSVAAGTPVFTTGVYSVQLTPYGTAAANMNRDIRLRGYTSLVGFDVVATRRYENNLDTCEFTYLAIGK